MTSMDQLFALTVRRNIGYSGADDIAKCLSCPPGKYASASGSDACVDCPAGRYQDRTRQDNCKQCQPGYSNSDEGQESCWMCPAGRFSATNGSTGCQEYPAYHYQNHSGQSACFPSKLGGQRWLENGVALGFTTDYGGVCQGVGAVMTYMREKTPNELANFETRSGAILASFVAGFGFGSEIFLVMGMWTTDSRRGSLESTP